MALSTSNLDFSSFVQGKHCMSYKCMFANETPLLKGANLCEFLANMDQQEYVVVTQENAELVKEQAEQQACNQNKIKNDQFYLRIAKYIFTTIGLFTLGKTLYWIWKARIERANNETWSQNILAFNNQPEYKKAYEDKFHRDDAIRSAAERKYDLLTNEKREKFGPTPLNKQYEFERNAEPWSNRSISVGIFAAACQLAEWVWPFLSRPNIIKNEKDLEVLRNRQLRILDKLRRIEHRVKAISDNVEIEQLERVKDYFKTFWNENSENASVVRHEHHKFHYRTN